MRNKRIVLLTLAILVSFFISSFLNVENGVKVEANNRGQLKLTFDEDIDESKFKAIVKNEINVPSIEFWHYSGGYWGDGKALNIFDAELKGDIPTYLEDVAMSKLAGKNGYKLDTPVIPKEVQEALNKGKNVIVQVQSRDGVPVGNMFNHINDVEKHNLKDLGTEMEFWTYPKFNYQQDGGSVVTLRDYGFNTKVVFPYVRDGLGAVGWSIWPRSGTRPGEWASYTYWKDWVANTANKITPDKLNTDGTLKSGHSIDTTRGDQPSGNIRVGAAGVFNSGGAFALHFAYPIKYNYYIEEDAKIIEDVILTNLQLFEKGGFMPLATFKREIIDPLDPLNPAKQKISGDFISPENPVAIDRTKKYELRATYQFISFLEGEFDITKYHELTQAQKDLSTEVGSNKLTEAEAYDEKAFMQGVFDRQQIIDENVPPMMMFAMMNIEVKHFKWDYEWDNSKKELVKLAGFIPEGHFPVEKNQNPLNDWGTVYAKIEQNDMGLSKLKLFGPDGKEVTHFEKGKKYTADVVVKHEKGTDIIGENIVTNPKPIINYKVTDAKNVLLPNNPKQTIDVLRPKQELTVPKSDEFSSEQNTIRVCATIDAIHRELGYNQYPANDTICKDFKVTSANNDIGLLDLKLYDSSGKVVEYIEPNKSYTADVVANHVVGNETIGTDPIKNPKVKIAYKVVEIGNREVLSANPKQTDKELRPGEKILMPRSNNFSSSKGFVKVCATIDRQHADLGFNFDPSNDTVCKEYEMVKNYSVLSFTSSPVGINFGKDETVLKNHPVGLNFTVAHETHKGATDYSTVEIIIKQGGKTVWTRGVALSPGSKEDYSIVIGTDLYPGNNIFTIEINPSRNPIEFKPGMPDPYVDNKRELSIRGTQFQECQECMIEGINKRNDWQEEWKWVEKITEIRTGLHDYCARYDRDWIPGHWRVDRWGDFVLDKFGNRIWIEGRYGPEYCGLMNYDVPYNYCYLIRTDRWEEIHNHWEEFSINEVRFGSKYNEDTKGVRNYPVVRNGNVMGNGEVKIKAGYGFELEVDLLYKTNRNIEPKPDPYNPTIFDATYAGKFKQGSCGGMTRNPKVVPVADIPKVVYVEMPYATNSGENVCYILNSFNDKGPWYNNTRTFSLPLRKTPTGTMERRVYINEDAIPNNKSNTKQYPIKIVTPRPDKPDRFYGYNPGASQIGDGKKSPGIIPGSYLHDCKTIYVVILPMDDIKSHIIQ